MARPLAGKRSAPARRAGGRGAAPARGGTARPRPARSAPVAGAGAEAGAGAGAGGGGEAGGPRCPGGEKCECDGTGRIAGGIGAVVGFGWWPIKAYRPCPALEAGGVQCVRAAAEGWRRVTGGLTRPLLLFSFVPPATGTCAKAR